jgi:hypothetical protein
MARSTLTTEVFKSPRNGRSWKVRAEVKKLSMRPAFSSVEANKSHAPASDRVEPSRIGMVTVSGIARSACASTGTIRIQMNDEFTSLLPATSFRKLHSVTIGKFLLGAPNR